MLTHNYLSLHLNRISRPKEWASTGEGLAFIFPNSGVGRYTSSSVTHRFGPGDVLVVNSTAGGSLGIAEGNELVFWSFAAHLVHLFPLFAEEEICLLQDLEDRLKTAILYGASSPVAAECHKLVASIPPSFNLDHRSHVLKIAAAVLSAELANARPQKYGFVRIDERLNNVFKTLHVDEILGLSVGELAGRFSCGRRHLNRLFHQHFGCSVAALRMEMRLLKAASLLRNPDAKVITVAEQCGFNHLGLFNTCFKRRFGLSPGQWRKPGSRAPLDSCALMSSPPQCQLRTNGLCPWVGDADHGKALSANGIRAQAQGTPARPVTTVGRNGKGNGKPLATLSTGRIRLPAQS